MMSKIHQLIREPPRNDVLAVVTIIGFGLFTFRGYFSGATAPNWDFWGGYLTTSYSWWDLGDFFNPPGILPYLLMGFPAYMVPQSGAFYIPIGVAAKLFDYGAWTAASLQGATVIFGVLGLYALLRRIQYTPGISLIVSVGYFFVPGFIGNAQHPDIVRGWAFLPWLLLLSIPSKKGFSYATAIVGPLIMFQFLVGAYPGLIVSGIYLYVFWVALMSISLTQQRVRYLGVQLWVVLIGVALSSRKWIPYIFNSPPGDPPPYAQIFSLKGMLTVVFPFDDAMPNDITMRTYFIVPILLMGCFFANFRDKRTILALLTIVVSFVLGPGFFGTTSWQAVLPGLDLSRFREQDFKVGIILGLLLLSASGLQTVLSEHRLFLPKKFIIIRWFAASSFCALLIISGYATGFLPSNFRSGVSYTVVSWLLLTSTLALTQPNITTNASMRMIALSPKTALVLIPVMGISILAIGNSWAWVSPQVWQVPRLAQEIKLWGSPISSLIAGSIPKELPTRPRRSGPPLPTTPWVVLSDSWNKSDFTRRPSMGGYALAPRNPYMDQYLRLIQDPMKIGFVQALNESSMASLVPVGDLTDDAFGCDREKRRVSSCMKGKAQVISWRPGEIVVRVETTHASQLVVNEVGHEGWTFQQCTNNFCGARKLIAQTKTINFLSASLEKDTEWVKFMYVTPHAWVSNVVFWGATALFALISTVGMFIGFRESPKP